jgi:hypothetical protein
VAHSEEGGSVMAERRFTLSVAQIQSLALKTMGFRPDHEVTIVQPWDDSMDVQVDIFNVQVEVAYSGTWGVYAHASENDPNGHDLKLNEGEMPRFYEWGQR